MRILPEGFQFSKTFEIGSYQINPKGMIRLKDLADLFQEIAWKHADSGDFGRILLDKNLMWALSRLEIKLIKPPVWGQLVTVLTGGRGIEKLFAFREFLVVTEAGEILARAMSSWLLVHTETKRIQRPEQVLTERLLFRSKLPEWIPKKVDFPNLSPAVETDYVVQASDLDLNDHVNNTSYIRLVEDLLASQNWVTRDLLINYLVECKLKDQIHISLVLFQGTAYMKGEVKDRIVFLALASLVAVK